MDLKQMKKSMNHIVYDVSKRYVGGEPYFTEIDAMIKNNISLLVSYVQWVSNMLSQREISIIFSGEIGNTILKLQYKKFIFSNPIILVNGGLRVDSDINFIKFYPSEIDLSLIKKFIMIDDSYYSGKTVRKVRELLNKYGWMLDDIYVFYDGSIDNKDNVKSLYRYHDTEINSLKYRQLVIV